MIEMVDVIDGQSFKRSEFVACPLCNEWREPRLIKARFGMKASVAECIPCRIAFQTPRPGPEASLAYMNWRWSSFDTYVADRDQQLKRAHRQLQYVEMIVKTPTTLLDFGAGAGSFVRAALDAGWEATGIEKSESAIVRAREYYNVNIMKELKEQQFNVITMWDVVEHLAEPKLVLGMLRNKLRPGGFLFIETGNYENWSRLCEGDCWGLYLFDHQFYFTPTSLRIVIEQSGFNDFTLLDVNRVGFRHLVKKSLRSPFQGPIMCYKWLQANRKWPRHGGINVMVTAARRPQ